MEKAGVVTCETAAKRKIGDKTRRMVSLAVNAEEAFALTETRRRTAPTRYEVVRLLAATGEASSADVCYFTGASARTLKAMEKAGILTFSEAEELRVPQIVASETEPGPPILLNDEQQAAYDGILALIFKEQFHRTPNVIINAQLHIWLKPHQNIVANQV